MSERIEQALQRADRSGRFDVLLSSGYLAFASHLGFLQGLAQVGISSAAMIGTSSGALVGALYSAGHDLGRIRELLIATPPLWFLRPSWRLWNGAFDSSPFLRFLRAHVPERFEDLQWPFAVGVVAADSGRHELLKDGSLPHAVLASCAVQRLIHPVRIGERTFSDGGAVDRLAVDAWRAWRPARQGILHRVARSMGNEAATDVAGLAIVNSPRSHNSLLRLRNFDSEMNAACERSRGALLQQL